MVFNRTSPVRMSIPSPGAAPSICLYKQYKSVFKSCSLCALVSHSRWRMTLLNKIEHFFYTVVVLLDTVVMKLPPNLQYIGRVLGSVLHCEALSSFIDICTHEYDC